MKKNKLFTMLFCAAAYASVAMGAATDTAQNAVALAANNKASIESVCKAVSGAVQNDTLAPSELMKQVLASRETWTSNQVAGLYKSVLLASPALSASFLDDVAAYEDAGKPAVVSAEASEGVKLLAALYGCKVSGVDADAVLASVLTDVVGAPMLLNVTPLKDEAPGTSVRRVRPNKPTPPSVSADN